MATAERCGSGGPKAGEGHVCGEDGFAGGGCGAGLHILCANDGVGPGTSRTLQQDSGTMAEEWCQGREEIGREERGEEQEKEHTADSNSSVCDVRHDQYSLATSLCRFPH